MAAKVTAKVRPPASRSRASHARPQTAAAAARARVPARRMGASVGESGEGFAHASTRAAAAPPYLVRVRARVRARARLRARVGVRVGVRVRVG